MTDKLTIEQKRVIFYILSLIMKTDNILNPAEVRFLDNVFKKFKLDISEFDHMDDVSFDELQEKYALFPPEVKEYGNNLFREMARCDGYVDPRELVIIQRLS